MAAQGPITWPGSSQAPARPPQGSSGILDPFGRWTPSTTDPGWQPFADPLQDRAATIARAKRIDREIPNLSVASDWDPPRVRCALQDLVVGLFDTPAQLHDATSGDSRVQSAMRQLTGLLGRPVRFKIPKRYRDNDDAKKCHRVWSRHWESMNAEPAMHDLLEVAASLGFSYAQILWDTTHKIWYPYLQSFNARYSYYHWTLRAHVAVTMDGQELITPGDAHWVLHAPNGQYRGWMRGSLRAISQWWLARNYCLRDFARYCERHGFPMLLADTPFGADANDIVNFQSVLAGAGQETTLQLPGSVDLQKYGRYDVRYLEPKDRTWQCFKELIELCNTEITLALLSQNLTTEVKEGSLAAARVHGDVRQVRLEAEARALARTIYTQLVRPFASLNFGNAAYAPIPQWDVRAPEDLEVKAKSFQSFASGLAQLRNAGVALDNVEDFARRFGLQGLAVHAVDPVQVEARLAMATGKVDTEDQARSDGTSGEET